MLASKMAPDLVATRNSVKTHFQRYILIAFVVLLFPLQRRHDRIIVRDGLTVYEENTTDNYSDLLLQSVSRCETLRYQNAPPASQPSHA